LGNVDSMDNVACTFQPNEIGHVYFPQRQCQRRSLRNYLYFSVEVESVPEPDPYRKSIGCHYVLLAAHPPDLNSVAADS
jgi:hypothetical protein